ncbi:3-oxosteroid 1-dehydrogenase [Leifsonia kafniensis]|uniref:3-oxosteroid 1-dehydrogenase n=1 Tax=Leifsonia kafniensis TaxID=475957 RepID=A0ABP7KUB1_9MICO
MSGKEESRWDEEYDVIAVGSGAGGVAAAIAAAIDGARVLVVEKYHELGGVTALSAGQIWIGPTTQAREAGIEDSVEDVRAYVDFLSAGYGNTDTRDAYIRTGPRVIDELVALGLDLQVIEKMPDYYYPTAPGSKAEGRYLEGVPFPANKLGEWEHKTISNAGVSTGGVGSNVLSNRDLIECGGDREKLAERGIERAARSERAQGAGISANLIAMALERGVEFRASTTVVELLGTDGVDGVVVDGASGQKRIRASRGVVLATGAYDWNPELMETFEYVRNLYSVVLPTVTGDHFKLASRFRAAIGTTLPQGKSTHLGIHIPGEEWGGRKMYRHMFPGMPHTVVVNRKGRRFGDESFFHSYVAALYTFDGDKQDFPNWPAWMVFDEEFRRKYNLGPLAAGAPMPEGMAITADTIENLAEAAGIDVEGLSETITRFNQAADSGVDDEFGRGSRPWSRLSAGDPAMKPNPNIGPVSKGPFHAIKLERVNTGLASAGLKTDEQARVIDVDGQPIRGLHAVGNTAARLEFGAGYNSGMAVGRSLVFGYLSGKSLMAG